VGMGLTIKFYSNRKICFNEAVSAGNAQTETQTARIFWV
jgi:hypothetical protein